MNKQGVVKRMCESGVLPVFRTSDVRHLTAASRAIYDGGIGCVEYTMTMPDALDSIKRGVAELPGDLCLGAGTITDGKTVDAAVKAGASFIASPGISPEMIKACRSNGVASVVGAVTPTEIMNALDLGADVIKVFCAASVGPVFFENMLGPFPGICMMAAGGITLQNLKDYIRAGAEIVTYVPNLIDPAAYAAGDGAPLTRTATTYVETVRAARQSR
ncbi:MAG: bifunctional 4-hydroxy-2-oxoglutarate aldolase/2-dehydro-3-deoxy-phosphogluconate aldolase [Thermoguttaceae bacterium]